MALFPCPDCGRQVSTGADACSYCGSPLDSADVAHRPNPTATALGAVPAKREDVFDRELLFDSGDGHVCFQFHSHGSLSYQTKHGHWHHSARFTVNWATGSIFLDEGMFKGNFKLFAGNGCVYLATPSGHVEFVLFYVVP